MENYHVHIHQDDMHVFSLLRRRACGRQETASFVSDSNSRVRRREHAGVGAMKSAFKVGLE